MKYSKSVLSFAVLVAASLSAADAPFDVLQIDNKACNLVVSGSRNQDIVWKGWKEHGLCSVDVPLDEFSKKYEVCALAGVLASKGDMACEFGYSDNAKTKVFFLSDTKSLCQFVCTRPR